MKIIALEREPGCLTAVTAEAITSHDITDPTHLQTTLIADSAVVRPRTPLFLPDFATGWILRIAPAITIGRLGKSIESRFAGRYVSGYRIVARLMPDSSQIPPAGLAATFDGAISLGPELETPLGEVATIAVRHPSLADGGVTLEVDTAQFETAKSIALVSRYMTLRTGDIIVPCMLPVSVRPEVDTRLQVDINGCEALNLKIK